VSLYSILTLKGILYIPTAKTILSGSKIVQNPEHRVEIDSAGSRIICNAGTRPKLHMNYNNEGELWYFIGARVSPTAQVCAVTHGTVSEDEDEVEQETSNASHISPKSNRSKLVVIIIILKKKLSLVICKIISLNPHLNQQHIRKSNRKDTTTRSPR
jgi:hypothetical protein